jgi:hypothetical protein
MTFPLVEEKNPKCYNSQDVLGEKKNPKAN